MHRIVFLGPPGAGKGTQAATLSRHLGVPHISTGDLLREAVAADTPFGREAESHIAAGRLVPDELVLAILGERLARADAKRGFVLDGFPRNLLQAQRLDERTDLDGVLSFVIPIESLLPRLTDRRICPTCHTVYNLSTRPPKVATRCDHDSTELIQRPDDLPEAVRTRLEVYHRETEPVIRHYRDRGLLRPLDATGSPDTVQSRIRAALG